MSGESCCNLSRSHEGHKSSSAFPESPGIEPSCKGRTIAFHYAGHLTSIHLTRSAHRISDAVSELTSINSINICTLKTEKIFLK